MKRGMSGAYATLIERVKEIWRLEAVEQLLDWDQETYMPPKGVPGGADPLEQAPAEAEAPIDSALHPPAPARRLSLVDSIAGLPDWATPESLPSIPQAD
jgi:hypothetical protein